MTTQKQNDGGPAFPHMMAVGHRDYASGMSLRDWFAGQAVVGIAAACPGPGCASWDYYSGAAYAIADAMLAERERARE